MMDKNEQNRFREEVDDFVNVCCEDYFEEREIVYDFTKEQPDADMSALVMLTDFSGMKWEVPIVYGFDKRIGIDIGDAGVLGLTARELYSFLWLEAKDRLEKRS